MGIGVALRVMVMGMNAASTFEKPFRPPGWLPQGLRGQSLWQLLEAHNS